MAASLKHLLNDDTADDFSYRSVAHRTFQPEINGSKEIPAIQLSWDSLSTECFNAFDFSNLDEIAPYGTSQEDEVTKSQLPWDLSFSMGQESIERWAEQDLSSNNNYLTPPEPSSGRGTPSSGREAPRETGQLLCYGMIHRVLIKLDNDMMKLDQEFREHQESAIPGYCFFKLSKDHNSQVTLSFTNGTKFGILNNHMEKSLQDIINDYSIEFDAFVHVPTVQEVIGRATKPSEALVHVNINVYGTRDAMGKLGRHLSKNKIYLQRPEQRRPESTYENPHYLKLPEIDTLSMDYLQRGKGDGFNLKNNRDEFEKSISDVYASLKRSTGLDRLEGDDRITTSLLQHQEEALAFMVQRELGPIPTEFCLWQPKEEENGTWYYHAVTNAKTRHKTDETGGGILADEMGMGKTLSILALITKTIKNAQDWANKPTADDSKKRSRATLVVVSSALLINNWLKEIQMRTDGTLRTTKYHGQKREAQIAIIEELDVVLTTYHTLAADFSAKTPDLVAKKSPLHEIAWYRIVLDEAHTIRRQTTMLYRTVAELQGEHRWCLTGTPIQNRLEDIGALLSFIRLRPFDSMAMFRRFISIPFEEKEERRQVASQHLAKLLDSVCIRRTKELLHLPDPRESTRYVEFSKEERDQYDQTKNNMNRMLRQKAESDKKSIFGIFQVQLQLRILCNHGTFQHPFSWVKRDFLNEREDIMSLKGRNGEVRCSLCQQPMPVLGFQALFQTYQNCSHILCLECLDENTLKSEVVENQSIPCPICISTGIHLAKHHNTSTMEDGYFRYEGYSSKMATLVRDVQENLWDSKSIIFSEWTRTLTLISKHLQYANIPFERIDGECPFSKRQKILDSFSGSSKVRVLLMTTGTGAFGLNVTAANRVFIVEPQWNPSVENQAIARAMRLGQDESVQVTRYVVRGTVEQEMLSQQQRKLKLAAMGAGNAREKQAFS